MIRRGRQAVAKVGPAHAVQAQGRRARDTPLHITPAEIRQSRGSLGDSSLPLRGYPAGTNGRRCRARPADTAPKHQWPPKPLTNHCAPKRSSGYHAQRRWQASSLTYSNSSLGANERTCSERFDQLQCFVGEAPLISQLYQCPSTSSAVAPFSSGSALSCQSTHLQPTDSPIISNQSGGRNRRRHLHGCNNNPGGFFGLVFGVDH